MEISVFNASKEHFKVREKKNMGIGSYHVYVVGGEYEKIRNIIFLMLP